MNQRDYRVDPYKGYVPGPDGQFKFKPGIRVTHKTGLQASVNTEKTLEKCREVAIAMLEWGMIFQNRLVTAAQQEHEQND